MSDSARKKFNFAILAFVLLAVVVLGSYLATMGITPPKKENGAFNPTTVSDLEIKGDLPDGSSSWSALEVPLEPAATPESLARGRELYGKACLGCHGAQGKGDGPVTKQFELPSAPANLAAPAESVKIHTTLNAAGGGIPLSSDLFRTITRGLPGTPMFSYRALPGGDRWAIVQFVRTFSAEYAKTPLAAQAIPEKPADSDGMLDAGSELYKTICFNCHGDKGLGGTVLLRGPGGKVYTGLMFARAGGNQMLGGSSENDIARTLMTGLDLRSPMRGLKPSLYAQENMSAEQRRESDRKFWGTVLYVRKLIETQSRQPATKE